MTDITVKNDTGEISDGYHTFNELYEHRSALFVALMKAYHQEAWKSLKHSDDSPMYPGYFIAGIGHIPGEQISYHLSMYWWDKIPDTCVYDRPPPFDGHTPKDVILRLRRL